MISKSVMILTTETVENSAGRVSRDHPNHYLKTANLASSWSWEKHFHTLPQTAFLWEVVYFPTTQSVLGLNSPYSKKSLLGS